MDELLESLEQGHEDELLEQGSSIDTISTHDQVSALTNPAERYDQLYGASKSASQSSKPLPSPVTTPTSANRSGICSDLRWPRSFPSERDTTSEIRVTIWNSTQQRKISGNAAPMEKNVDEYLRKHPDCEIYNGQDKVPGAVKYDRNGHTGDEKPTSRRTANADKDKDENQRRVVIWNRVEKRKLSGNCAPLEKNLEQYLKDNPNCEVVNDKVKKVPKKSRAREQAANGGATTGNDSSTRGSNQGDITNGNQGFVYFDPFGTEDHSVDVDTPSAMTLESLCVKPNPKIASLELPKFGVDGKILEINTTADVVSKLKENKTAVGVATC